MRNSCLGEFWPVTLKRSDWICHFCRFRDPQQEDKRCGQLGSCVQKTFLWHIGRPGGSSERRPPPSPCNQWQSCLSGRKGFDKALLMFQGTHRRALVGSSQKITALLHNKEHGGVLRCPSKLPSARKDQGCVPTNRSPGARLCVPMSEDSAAGPRPAVVFIRRGLGHSAPFEGGTS